VTEADQIVASLLEYDADLDIEATVKRWKPEVRLLSTTVTARTGGKVEGFDVILYGDKDPVYVGTIAPRGKNVWHTVHIMGNVTPLEMRQAGATWARSPEEAAQMLIDATKRSWEPVMRYQKAWAGLAEEEDPKDYINAASDYWKLKWTNARTDAHGTTHLRDGTQWWFENARGETARLVHYDDVWEVHSTIPYPASGESSKIGEFQTPNLETARAEFVKLADRHFRGIAEATDPKAVIDQEAEKAEAPKSDEHAEAGNYKKGHVAVQGMQITIENAKGSTRSGEDKNGKPWSVTIPAHYGYIAQVGGETAPRGKDKDHIDVYIGPNPGGMMVYVVNQNDEKGSFDEHKCMLGFESKEEAIKTYDAAFSGDLGPKLRGEVVSVTMKEFKEWLKSGKTKKPFERLAESLVTALIENVDEFDPKDEVMRHADLEQVATSLGYRSDGTGYWKDVRFAGQQVTLYLEQYDQTKDPSHDIVDRLVSLSVWLNFHRKDGGTKGWFGSAMYNVMVLADVLPEIEHLMQLTLPRFYNEVDAKFRAIIEQVGKYST
jgi:hypothetical protein